MTIMTKWLLPILMALNPLVTSGHLSMVIDFSRLEILRTMVQYVRGTVDCRYRVQYVIPYALSYYVLYDYTTCVEVCSRRLYYDAIRMKQAPLFAPQ